MDNKFSFGAAGASSGSLFGANPSTSSSQTPSSTAATSAPLFGALGTTSSSAPSFKFGPSSSQSTSSSTLGTTTLGSTTPAPAKPFFSLGTTTPSATPPVSSAPKSLFGSSTTMFGSSTGNTPTSGAENRGTLFSLGKENTSTTTTTSASPLSFGTPAASQAPAPKPLFGGATGGSTLFGQNSSNTPKPASETTAPKLTLGGGSMITAQGANSAPAPSNLFGNLQKPATSTPASAASATTPAAPAGFSLFNKAATPSTSTSTPSLLTNTNAPSAASPNLFGAKSTAPDASAAKPTPTLFGSMSNTPASQEQPKLASTATVASTPAPATTSAPSSGFSLFGKPATNTTTTTTTPSMPAASASTTTAGPSTLGGSTLSVGQPAAARLKNKSMDEILTRWATDLTKHQKEFQNLSQKVATWDDILVQNTDVITKLLAKTLQAERDAAEVEKQLTNVESQQEELEQWLDRYEREADEMIQRAGLTGDMGGVDVERERTYKLAERLTDRLEGLNKDLTDVIEEINGVSAMLSNSSSSDDPLSHVVRVLNSHLSQLQKIDTDASVLQSKVQEAQKHARAMGGSDWRVGSDPSEEFYRSFSRG